MLGITQVLNVPKYATRPGITQVHNAFFVLPKICHSQHAEHIELSVCAFLFEVVYVILEA